MASISFGQRVVKALPVLVGLGVGLIAGANMPEFAGSSPAHAAATMSPLDKLLIEDEIRQKIALYGLYADGDGAGGNPRDLRTLADDIMTEDVVSEIHVARGGPPLILKGRDVIAKSPPEIDPERARHVAGRHYLVLTSFDLVTPDTVMTRTPSVYFDATKNLVGPGCEKDPAADCGGRPVKTIMWVYHMTWKKTPQGWKIAKNTLRDDN